jgi:serralysin
LPTRADTIRLENTIFGVFSASPLATERFALGAAQDGKDNIICDGATGALPFGVDGTGAAAAVQFARLGAGLAPTELDFPVV